MSLSPDARSTAVGSLREPGTGPIFLPDEPGYDAARAAWMAATDQRPAAVATPTTPAEVAAVVKAAAAAGLRVAPQSTGHSASPLPGRGLDDVVLVRTGALDEVTIDAANRRARVGSGVVWEPAVTAAAEHGLAALHGSSPNVGIAGYSLGGGASWYARQLGLATNSLTGVELITADGELVRASHTENPDLFWALRGGGGSFGVVTALEFRLYDFSTAYAGLLLWDVADAERVLRTWARWAPAAPEAITTAFRILNLPPLPDIPEVVRGRHIAVIDGAILADDDRAAEILAELRAQRPEVDTFARVPTPAITRIHMDPEPPTPAVTNGALLAAFPDAAVDAFVAELGVGTRSTLFFGELRQLGGALVRPAEGGGALDRLDGDFSVLGVAIVPTPQARAAGEADARALVTALAPWANGRHYLNFTERADVDPRTFFPEEVWSRLTAIRATVDPGGLFVANHPIGREAAPVG
ncbi:FAD-binding oxidoreductase [Georgenia ruanii]|uniref:FAD-binding protein n=1 Tax=Georgenia ruanii TaxID=348442 RepID=A0A7J9UX31_9MICO|nr:FAD-binding oxidoreductase [Georgenia ruanii]MPV89186.1 FAD-binding protein [Georgenia ruanii]